MKSIRRSHIVVVHDEPSNNGGEQLAARLRRMPTGQVTIIAGIEEAGRLCRAGGIDACLVVIGEVGPDLMPPALRDAPDGLFGTPTLIVAPVVTPYLRKTARLRGYGTVLPAKIAPRMLYRRLGAVLQGRGRRRAPASGREVITAPSTLANFAKPTVH